MTWDASVSRAHPTTPPCVQLGLLATANLLAAVGGGRVTSAAKGVTGITMLGSGPLLAFLLGSAAGLALVVMVRRCPLGQALVSLSLAAAASSCMLLAILWLDAGVRWHVGASTVWNVGQATLSGAMAWLFFLGLVIRYALWFAGRSLRSDLAAFQQVSWLAVAESAYFVGFIIGLLIGPVTVAGRGGVVGALLLDVLLLCVVAGCDLWHRRPIALHTSQSTRGIAVRTRPLHRLRSGFSQRPSARRPLRARLLFFIS